MHLTVFNQLSYEQSYPQVVNVYTGRIKVRCYKLLVKCSNLLIREYEESPLKYWFQTVLAKMTLVLEYIPTDHDDFILAKISKPSTAKGPSVIILPGQSNLDVTVTRFALSLTDEGIACCLPYSGFYARGSGDKFAKNSCIIWDLSEINYAMQHMATARESNGKVAVIGFGIGGKLAYLAASRLNPEAAIIYHGKEIDAYLQEGRHINCQTVFHSGKNDPNISDEMDSKIHAALIGKFNIAIYKYDAGDAFTNEDDPGNYAPEAARLAHKRTLDVLRQLK